MKLSRAATYALYGLAHLAEQPPARYAPLSEIRRRWGVPEKHLAKIFQTLVRAGLLESARGVNGGFTLARPACDVSVLDVIQLVDGPVAEEGCLLHGEPCRQGHDGPVNAAWRRAQRPMVAALRQTSLADLVSPPEGATAAQPRPASSRG